MSDMNEQQFELMLQMHKETHAKIDSVHAQLEHANGKLERHIEDDNKVHAVVQRHMIYWRAVWGAISTGFAAALTWIGLSK